ncbi:uncharacterized mitochondrial protein AtMg00810-like [Telopea speciosissima]|uniref:uncharacterized mitochondrial protein AtMg00810-like n=1 Tax=Telopea speciosissima TaxID=54955 RepID=UPI001CC76019|nr:uncharacterized mitochondrial protein AtMg00810-like [Telopea speciosissima]
MFVKRIPKGTVAVLVYVDDIVITSDNHHEITNMKQHLKEKFDIKDLGKLRYFLGIEVASSNKGLFISQRKYALDLLKETRKMGAKPVDSPMDYNSKFLDDSTPLPDVGRFQRLAGRLIYLTITRPDITYAVSYISQFMHAPTKGNMNLVNRILSYVKSCPRRGILMGRNGDTKVVGYASANWAGNPIDRRSTTGFCTFV